SRVVTACSMRRQETWRRFDDRKRFTFLRHWCRSRGSFTFSTSIPLRRDLCCNGSRAAGQTRTDKMTSAVEKAFSQLGSRLEGRVFLPGSAAYVAAMDIWAKRVGGMPRAVARWPGGADGGFCQGDVRGRFVCSARGRRDRPPHRSKRPTGYDA